MIDIIKKHGKIIQAWRLGEPSLEISNLIQERKIIPLPDGCFEIMSREAFSGGSGHGQIARRGDYVKIDNGGFPYPNDAAFFEANHVKIEGNRYEQIPVPLKAWTIDQPICPEIIFLQKNKGLIIRPDDFEHTFTAPLWGTVESAPGDAIVVFYSISYAKDGAVADADFSFVVREEFEKSYNILSGG